MIPWEAQCPPPHREEPPDMSMNALLKYSSQSNGFLNQFEAQESNTGLQRDYQFPIINSGFAEKDRLAILLPLMNILFEDKSLIPIKRRKWI